MASVTARDMLALLHPYGARLVAGAAGLERPITWACTARASPPAYAELRGGELALVALGTLAALRAQDDALTLARLIQHLDGRGVAAVAVAGLLASEDTDSSPAPPASASTPPGAARPARDDELRLASALGLPLVSLPVGAPLPDIERAIIAAIARPAVPESATAATGTPRAFYDALVHDSLRGDDDRALGERLAGLTSAAAVLGDARDIRWCAVPPGFPLAREALLNLLRRPSARAHLRALLEGADAAAPGASGERQRDTLPSQGAPAERRTVVELPLGGGYRWLAVPLAVREGAHLLLALVAPETPATPAIAASGAAGATATEARGATLSATLAQVAPLFALTVARQRDLDSSRATLRAETLDALLAGTYPDEDRMRARAAQLGYDLARPHIALVVDLTPQPPSHVGQGEPDSSTTQKQNAASTFPLHSISGASGSFPLVGHRAASGSPPHAGEGLGERFAAALEGAWARVSDGELVALVPVALEATPAESGALAERLRALLAAEPGEWCAGMTEPATGPAALRRAAGAARDTARLGCLVLGPGHVARPADLGIYRLLLRLRETQELADFCRQALGPLLAKGRHAETLLTTLDVFFACNGNFSEAARRLGLHRNSLIYRVKRIRDLLSRDLEDPEERLALQLALKAHQVLELRAPG